MFRKILLLICVAFVVVCYAFPCFTLPFGSYKGEIGVGELKVEKTLTFDFNGKVKVKTGKDEREHYYKLDGNYVVISEDNKFDDQDMKVKLNSMYSLDYGTELINNVGMYMAIGIGALAVILILLPNKRR